MKTPNYSITKIYISANKIQQIDKSIRSTGQKNILVYHENN